MDIDAKTLIIMLGTAAILTTISTGDYGLLGAALACTISGIRA
jgi:hypothetical protein